LSGTDLMNPKKNKKNHSGIILSDVLTTLHKIKDSSWKTKNHPKNTTNINKKKAINIKKQSRMATKVKNIIRSK